MVTIATVSRRVFAKVTISKTLKEDAQRGLMFGQRTQTLSDFALKGLWLPGKETTLLSKKGFKRMRLILMRFVPCEVTTIYPTIIRTSAPK